MIRQYITIDQRMKGVGNDGENQDEDGVGIELETNVEHNDGTEKVK